MGEIRSVLSELLSPVYAFANFLPPLRATGDIFKITVFGQQIVFVGSVALCEEICDQRRFRKFVGGPIVEIRHAVHGSLFTAFENEASWGIHHRILSPLVTPDVVAGHFAEIRDVAAELMTKWRGLKGRDAQISPIGELNRLDLETTTLCCYGRRLNGLTGPEHPMIKAMDGATGEAIMRPTRPSLLNRLFYQGKFDRDTNAMRKYAAECLGYRRQNPTDRKDLLWAMINGKDPETGKTLDDSQIIDEIVTMPIGSSTAPCAVSSAMYYLTKNPNCITKARAELDSVIGRNGEFTHAHLDQIPYCTAIMQETMRLCAPAPGFNIEPRPDIYPSPGPNVSLANGKYSVPPTQTLIVVLHGVNRDPAVFEDPEAFKPERMMDGGFEKLPEGAKKWFGNGKRVCFGKEFAWMWNMVVLVTLLRSVDFEGVEMGYGLRSQGWFNLRPVGFNVKVKARGE